MKTSKSAAILATIVAFLGCPLATANGFNPDLVSFDLNEHRVTVRLTRSTNSPLRERETRAGVNFSQRIITERISNAAILRIFRDDGVINNIRGWSIVMLTWNGRPYGILLNKRGEAPIFVDDYFNIDIPADDAVQRIRGRRTIAGENLVIQSNATTKVPGSIDFIFGSHNTTLQCSGMFQIIRQNVSTTSPSIGGETTTADQIVRISLNSGSGFVTQDAQNDAGFNRIGIIEGRYRFTRGIRSDIPRILTQE